MTTQGTSVHIRLRFLCLILALLAWVCMGTFASADPITPQQAVSEMTWGVNLSTLYMADKIYDENGGNSLGYCDQAPLGIGIWFWDGSFDWITYTGLHDRTFTASVTIPETTDYTNHTWFRGMFELGIFLSPVSDLRATFQIQNMKITTKSGQVYPLDLDGLYTIDDFGEFDEYDLACCQLHVNPEKLPSISSEFNGAVLEMTVHLLEVPFSETGKVDYFFEYQREKMDQYELTNIYLDQGVNVFRLPVTWTQAVQDQPPFTIDPAWLAAIKTEVDYILDHGAYCILNMHDDYMIRSYVGDHWEDAWMLDEYKEYVDARFHAVWAQIADYFKDYPHTLIFETANEPAMDWNLVSPKHPEISMSEYAELHNIRTNELNQIMVDTTRESGGNNSTRLICLSVGNYNSSRQLAYLDPPDDEYLIAQLHSYQEMEDNGRYDLVDYNFDYVGKTDAFFEDVNTFTNRTGIPVLIGEAGVSHKLDENTRKTRLEYYVQKCEENNVPALWWEDYFLTDDGYYYWLYDLKDRTWGESGILETILETYSLNPGPMLAAPTISINHENYEVPFGELLEVVLTNVDNAATEISGYVIAGDHRTIYTDFEIITENDSRIIRFPTENMPIGNYSVMIKLSADGRRPAYASGEFSVVRNGCLDVAVLYGFPTVSFVNEPLNGSFELVENAEWYDMQLRFCGDDRWAEGSLITGRSVSAEGDTTNLLSIDGALLSQTGFYKLFLYANANTRHSSEAEAVFQILDPVTGYITLTVEDQTGTVANWPGQKDYRVKVTAPGATAIRILNEWQCWEYWDSRDLDENGMLVWWLSSDEGNYHYIAQAAYDQGYDWEQIDKSSFDWNNLSWSAISNEVCLQVVSQGLSDEAEFMMPDTIQRGELLPVTIISGGDKHSPSRSTRFKAYFVDGNGNSYGEWADTGWIDSLPVTLCLPTGQEDAEELRIRVEAVANGFNRRMSEIRTVQMTQSSGSSVFVFDVQDEIIEGGQFSVSAWCPGAAWITLWVQGSEGDPDCWGDYPGDFIQNMWLWLENVGTYDFFAIAHFTDQSGRETGIRESIHLNREVGYLGEFQDVDIIYPAILPANMNLSFAILNLNQPGLNYWDIRVMDHDGWTETYRWVSDDYGNNPDVFTAPALLPDGNYSITVWVDGPGYPGIYSEFSFETSSGNRILQLPANLKKIDAEAFTGIDAVTVVISEDVSTIGCRAFAGSSIEAVYIPDSVTQIENNSFDEGVVFFGKVPSVAKEYADIHGIPFVRTN